MCSPKSHASREVWVLLVGFCPRAEKACGYVSLSPAPADSGCTCSHPPRPWLDGESRPGGSHRSRQITAEKKSVPLSRKQRGLFRNFSKKSHQQLWSSLSVPNLWPEPLMFQMKPLLLSLSSHKIPFYYERRPLLYLIKWPCTHLLAECHPNPVTIFLVLSFF